MKIRGVDSLVSEQFEDAVPDGMVEPMDPSELSGKGTIVQFPSQFSAQYPRQFGL
ncbi:MAG: hypothetical protein II901_00110 [Paludibacteraceae bacterium]|nr:hypothetical protein [Paludibacteraceae bacterium]